MSTSPAVSQQTWLNKYGMTQAACLELIVNLTQTKVILEENFQLRKCLEYFCLWSHV